MVETIEGEKMKNTDEKRFWIQTITLIILIQAGLVSFGFVGEENEQKIITDLADQKLEYYLSQNIEVDNSGNPKNPKTLNPVQISAKNLFDNAIETRRYGNLPFSLGLFALIFFSLPITLFAFLKLITLNDNSNDFRKIKNLTGTSIISILLAIIAGIFFGGTVEAYPDILEVSHQGISIFMMLFLGLSYLFFDNAVKINKVKK